MLDPLKAIPNSYWLVEDKDFPRIPGGMCILWRSSVQS